jgi:glutamine cyclotransferase
MGIGVLTRKLYLLPLLMLACVACSPGVTAGVPEYGYRVVNAYPHRMDAFTQGLQFHEGYLYEGTGLHGRSSLARVDLESGEVLHSRPLAEQYFGEGIAIVDDRIFQLTWRSNVVFVHDLETFETVTTFYHPGEGWGLAYDGDQLILSDGTDELQFINPEDFSVQRRQAVTLNGSPVTNLNELAWINGEVWANVWMSQQIVRINPDTGEVVAVVDLTGLIDQTQIGGSRSESVLNGIAWDEAQQRLLVTGKLWADIFEIEAVPR